jgi:hypothetical protein
MSAVFIKTEKGTMEMTAKTGGLTPRVRRVLIFIDGKRTVDELRDMLRADDLQNTLGSLEEAGYIELLTTISAKAPAAANAATQASITAFGPLPVDADPLRLQQSRNFMLNTIKTFVGALGSSSLLDRIENAKDHPGLRLLYDEWYHSIVMSSQGRREAETLRTKLLQII